MSWAKVKKINSDMATPLDVLIKTSNFLLASNDNVIIPIIQKETAIPTKETQIGQTFTVNMPGTIRIYFSGEATSTNILNFLLVIEVNGVRSIHHMEGQLTSGIEDLWYDLTVNKGDEITLSIYEQKSYSEKLYKCSVNGMVVFSPAGEPIAILE